MEKQIETKKETLSVNEYYDLQDQRNARLIFLLIIFMTITILSIAIMVMISQPVDFTGDIHTPYNITLNGTFHIPAYLVPR